MTFLYLTLKPCLPTTSSKKYMSSCLLVHIWYMFHAAKLTLDKILKGRCREIRRPPTWCLLWPSDIGEIQWSKPLRWWGVGIIGWSHLVVVGRNQVLHMDWLELESKSHRHVQVQRWSSLQGRALNTTNDRWLMLCIYRGKVSRLGHPLHVITSTCWVVIVQFRSARGELQI